MAPPNGHTQLTASLLPSIRLKAQLALSVLACLHAFTSVDALRPDSMLSYGRHLLGANSSKPAPLRQTYDIITPTHGRRASLSAGLVEHIFGNSSDQCRQLSRIYIYYNDKAQPDPPAALSAVAAKYARQVTLVVLPHPFDLNVRFKLPNDSTATTFLINDDDVRIPCSGVCAQQHCYHY